MNIAEMNCKLFRKDTLRENKISCEFRSHLAYNCDQMNEKKNRAVKMQCFKFQIFFTFQMTCHFRIYLNSKEKKA